MPPKRVAEAPPDVDAVIDSEESDGSDEEKEVLRAHDGCCGLLTDSLLSAFLYHCGAASSKREICSKWL